LGNDFYGGHSSGYLHCNPKPPARQTFIRRDQPCLLESGQNLSTMPDRAPASQLSSQKLADHWYAYDQAPH
jgi:hypothetical protein